MPELSPGALVDRRYRVQSLIARGGMSAIYRGVDERLDRPIALKVLDDRFAHDQQFRLRFEREARAVAKLSHPTLVNVYDQGDDGNVVFLAMELVDGGTLRELLRERGPMPPHAATAVMQPVLTALGIAHSAGLVHRDVKPENILISDAHKVKLADFGLVRAMAESSLTNTSVMMGTVAYLSPEQVRGGEIDARSDVYSAGIVLYELLTGVTPFHADTSLGTAYLRLDHEVPPATEAIDGVPSQFDELIRTATAIDPAQRFSNGTQFYQELTKVAIELGLPLSAFRVPVPRDSASHRSIESAQRATAAAANENAPTTISPQANQSPAPGSHHQSPAPGAEDPTTVIGGAADPKHQAASQHNQQGTHQDGLFPGAHPTSAETRVDSLFTARPAPASAPAQPAQPAPPPNRAADWSDRSNRGAPQMPAPPVPGPTPHRAPEPAQRRQSAPPIQEKPQVTNHSRVGCVLWALLAIILVAAISVGAWWLGSGRYGEIPSVIGSDASSATAAIRDAGFEVSQTTEYSDDIPSDHVASLDPEAGTRTTKGSIVKVTVSAGRPTVPQLPDDRSVDNYTNELAERTLTTGETKTEYSSNVPSGKIIGVSPAVGTTVPVNSAVTLTVSKGEKPITVPDLAGKTESDAKKALAQLGLNVEVATDDVITSGGKDTVGKVTRTSPAANQEVKAGDTVTIYLSPEVSVPNLLGSKVSDARAKLDELELTLDAQDAQDNDRVIWQSPRAGSTVKRGSTVEVSAF